MKAGTIVLLFLHLQFSTRNTVALSNVNEAVNRNVERVLEDRTTSNKRLSILLLTVEAASHSLPMVSLGEALVQKGHKVTILAGEMMISGSNKTMTKLRTWCEDKNIEFVSAGKTEVPIPTKPEDWSSRVPVLVKMIPSFLSIQESMFENVKYNKDLLASTDVVVVGMVYASVAEWLNDNTNLTVLTLTTAIPIYTNTVPSWYYPTFPANTVGPDNPTFYDRFKRSFVSGIVTVLTNTLAWPIKHRLPFDVPGGVKIPDIVCTSFGFDYPRPLYPLTHYVGPIVSSKKESVSGDLKEWLDNHTTPHSVIYLSMGSIMQLQQTVARGLIHGIMESGYDLLWSFRGNSEEILHVINDDYVNSGRILISKWLPQATVLHHSSIAMAVLHGGAGGVNEALLAGVPIICLPQHGDQPMNCARVKHQGLGVNLGHREELTTSESMQAIQDVKDLQCGGKARKVSRIFKAAGGASKAVELIEYYHEIGYDHLIPAWSKYNWNFIQFYNLDVYVLLAVLGYLVFHILKRVCLLCYRRRPCGRKTLKTD